MGWAVSSGPIRIGPRIQYSQKKNKKTDTRRIRIYGVSDTYPYPICIGYAIRHQTDVSVNSTFLSTMAQISETVGQIICYRSFSKRPRSPDVWVMTRESEIIKLSTRILTYYMIGANWKRNIADLHWYKLLHQHETSCFTKK